MKAINLIRKPRLTISRIISIVAAFLLPTAWLQYIHRLWLGCRLTWVINKHPEIFGGEVSLEREREGKLFDARHAIAELRKGKQFLGEEINWINEALEARWSYEDIGTTADEVISFRNGESQKIAARQLLAEFRQRVPYLDTHLLEMILKEAKLRPEDIGTTAEEIKAVYREYLKQAFADRVNDLRELAAGREENVRGWYKNPDSLYHIILTTWAGGEHNFTLADFGTSQEELDQLLKAAQLQAQLKRECLLLPAIP